MHPNISRHFIIRFLHQLFRWATVPMGWSHSPRLAQCLSWYIILRRKRRVTPDCLREAIEQVQNSAHSPKYSFLYKSLNGERIRVGARCVVDRQPNSLQSRSGYHRRFRETHVRQNVAEQHVHAKTWRLCSPREIRTNKLAHDVGPCFLETQVRVCLVNKQWELQRRHDEEKAEK
jgi:hypothetical protein